MTTGPNNANPDWITIGFVSRPHGVRGELRVQLQPADVDVPRVSRLLLRSPAKMGHGAAERVVEVKGGRTVPGAWLVRIAGCDDRNAADLLRQSEVAIPAEELPQPKRGEVYLFEIVGAAVLDEAGAHLGEAVAIDDNHGQSLLTIRRPGGDEVLLPLVDETWVRFERRERRLVVRPIPGLWELTDAPAGSRDPGEGT